MVKKDRSELERVLEGHSFNVNEGIELLDKWYNYASQHPEATYDEIVKGIAKETRRPQYRTRCLLKELEWENEFGNRKNPKKSTGGKQREKVTQETETTPSSSKITPENLQQTSFSYDIIDVEYTFSNPVQNAKQDSQQNADKGQGGGTQQQIAQTKPAGRWHRFKTMPTRHAKGFGRALMGLGSGLVLTSLIYAGSYIYEALKDDKKQDSQQNADKGQGGGTQQQIVKASTLQTPADSTRDLEKYVDEDAGKVRADNVAFDIGPIINYFKRENHDELEREKIKRRDNVALELGYFFSNNEKEKENEMKEKKRGNVAFNINF